MECKYTGFFKYQQNAEAKITEFTPDDYNFMTVASGYCANFALFNGKTGYFAAKDHQKG
jgi:hypothetical protein